MTHFVPVQKGQINLGVNFLLTYCIFNDLTLLFLHLHFTLFLRLINPSTTSSIKMRSTPEKGQLSGDMRERQFHDNISPKFDCSNLQGFCCGPRSLIIFSDRGLPESWAATHFRTLYSRNLFSIEWLK